MEKKRLFALKIGICLVLLSLLLAVACAQQQAPAPKAPTTTTPAAPKPPQVYKWRLQTFIPPTPPYWTQYVTVDLVNKIKEASKGQIEITPYSAGQLIAQADILKQTAAGVVEMGNNSVGHHLGIIPCVAVADGLPMSFRDPQEMLKCYYEKGLGDLFKQEFAKNGVYFLTPYIADPYTVASSKPLQTQADWNGIKLRSQGIYNKLFGKLGASPVDMPAAETYMGLTMHTVDGTFAGVHQIYSNKYYEVCKYGVWPPLSGAAMHDFYINLNTWNSLPDDLKKAVDAAAADWTRATSADFTKVWQDEKAKITAMGFQWLDVQDRSWLVEKSKELWAEIEAKDAPSKKAVQIMTDYLKEVGAIK
jgi:TRAP-type C4-dicarboxylate transport system substrate-binding protein